MKRKTVFMWIAFKEVSGYLVKTTATSDISQQQHCKHWRTRSFSSEIPAVGETISQDHACIVALAQRSEYLKLMVFTTLKFAYFTWLL